MPAFKVCLPNDLGRVVEELPSIGALQAPCAVHAEARVAFVEIDVREAARICERDSGNPHLRSPAFIDDGGIAVGKNPSIVGEHRVREQAGTDHVGELEVRRMGSDVLHARMANRPSATSNVVAIQFTRPVVVVVGQREPDAYR